MSFVSLFILVFAFVPICLIEFRSIEESTLWLACEVIMMLGLEGIANDYQKNSVHHAGNVTISRADCPAQAAAALVQCGLRSFI